MYLVNEYHIFWSFLFSLVVIIIILMTNRSKTIDHITTTFGHGALFSRNLDPVYLYSTQQILFHHMRNKDRVMTIPAPIPTFL
jgi:hypothetical protein